jgi:hypothetical protein
MKRIVLGTMSYSAGTTPSGGWPAWTVSGNTLDGQPFTPKF